NKRKPDSVSTFWGTDHGYEEKEPKYFRDDPIIEAVGNTENSFNRHVFLPTLKSTDSGLEFSLQFIIYP
ncbi:hypothetical protein COW82_02625, partial [Candidatus Campbellbacteria bacterium CG22_combo_CG10-13_8_21_14_all_43_18]